MSFPEFQHLLLCFLENNNDIIQNATNTYNSLIEMDISQLIQFHLQNIIDCFNQSLGLLSIILLKRLFNNDNEENLKKINNETICLLEEAIPKFFENGAFPKNTFINLIDMASTIFSKMIQYNRMLDFIPKLFEIVKTFSPALSSYALDCIAQCYNYVNFISSNELHFILFDDICNVISHVLNNPCSNIELTLATLRALFSFYCKDKETCKLSIFAPAVSQAYKNIIEIKDSLPQALFDLYIFCKNSPDFFSESISILLASMLIILSSDFSSSTKNRVIDIIICLAYNFSSEFIPYLTDITSALMLLSCNVDDDICETDNEPYSDYGIFQLSYIFSGNSMYPDVIIKLSKQMNQRKEWQCIRSALSSIDMLIKSCDDGLETYFNEIFEIIESRLIDQNHICRCYAYRALYQLCITYSSCLPIDKEAFESLIQLVLQTLNQECYYPSKYAEIEIIQIIFENCPLEILKPIAGHVIQELYKQLRNIDLSKLSSDSINIESLIEVKCISVIAIEAQIECDQLYQPLMEILGGILDKIPPGDESKTRIQAIQLVPLIGRLIYKSFEKDGIAFIYSLLQTFSPNFHLGNGEIAAILSSFQKICEIIPESFSQILPEIISCITNILSSPIEMEEFPLSLDLSSLNDKIIIPFREKNIIITYSKEQIILFTKCIETLAFFTSINSLNIFNVFILNLEIISKSIEPFITFQYFGPIQTISLDFVNNIFHMFSRNFFYQNPTKQQINIIQQYVPYVKKLIYSIIFNLQNYSSLILLKSIDLITYISIFSVRNQIEHLDSINIEEAFSIIPIILDKISNERREIMAKTDNPNLSNLIPLDEIEISIECLCNFYLKYFSNSFLSFFSNKSLLLYDIFQLLFQTDKMLLLNTGDIQSLLQAIFDSLTSDRLTLVYAGFLSLSKLISKINDIKIANDTILKAECIIDRFDDDESFIAQNVIDSALITLACDIKIIVEHFHDINKMENIIIKWFNKLPTNIDIIENDIIYEVLCILIENNFTLLFTPENILHLLKCLVTALTKSNISEEIRFKVITLIKSLYLSSELHDCMSHAISLLPFETRKHIISLL